MSSNQTAWFHKDSVTTLNMQFNLSNPLSSFSKGMKKYMLYWDVLRTACDQVFNTVPGTIKSSQQTLSVLLISPECSFVAFFPSFSFFSLSTLGRSFSHLSPHTSSRVRSLCSSQLLFARPEMLKQRFRG